MNRIGFGLRAAAFLIDCVIIVLLTMILMLIVGHERRGGLAAAGMAGLAMAACEVLRAQSLGKMILHLRIVSTSGAAATSQKLVLRSAIKYIAFAGSLLAAVTLPQLIYLFDILGLIVGLGCLLALADAKQALHDLIAETCVVAPTPSMTGYVQPAMPTGAVMPGAAI